MPKRSYTDLHTDGLRVGTSAPAGHVLTADAEGTATWQPTKHNLFVQSTRPTTTEKGLWIEQVGPNPTDVRLWVINV